MDSVKAGKLLPWDAYRVVDEGVGQKVLAFNNGKITSEASTQVRGYKEQTERSWYTKQLQERDGAHQASGPSRFLSSQAPPTPDKGNEIRDGPESYDSAQAKDLPSVAEESTLTPPITSPLVAADEDITEEQPASSTTHKASVPSLTNPLQHEAEENAPYEELDVSLSFEEAMLADNEIDSDQLKWESDNHYDLPNLRRNTTSPTRVEDNHDSEFTFEELDNEELSDVRDIGAPHTSQKRPHDAEDGPNKRTKMTAEEHNAMLLADPRVRKSTVVDPGFLEQYYRESRLHHLSTWKADLKSQLQAMTAQHSSSQKARQKRAPGTRRYILHVDFDSFFAAVSLKKNPQYKDKPVVVAHGTGRGSEIASCNYPARKFGIKNGMWMKRALEMCPDLKILPYDFPAYEEASREFYEAILSTSGVVQSVSIDEALVDVSQICIEAGGSDGKAMSEDSIYREQSKADEIAQQLRDDIKTRTDCNVSVGIGSNILLAKVALRKAKPAGQYQVKPEEVLEFIGGLGVRDLPGVAYSIGGKLEEAGIKCVKDIRDFSREKLMTVLGPKTGEKIWDYSRGIDRTEVGEQVVRKSVSAEINWGVRFENSEQVDEFIHNLCGELRRRLLKEGVKGKQLTMKIMKRAADAPLDPPKHLGHGRCDTFNKSTVLGVATNDQDIMSKEVLSMLKSFGFPPGELRGIGIQMTKLESLKPGGDGQRDSSQRRLQFKVSEEKKPPVRFTEPEDPIQDDVETPKKPKPRPDQALFGAAELNQSSPSRKPLNTLGTQFILPTQVDPKVLAELPADIRARLAKLSGARQAQQADNDTPPSTQLEESDGQSRKPLRSFPLTALPNESQLDPDTLAALPDDVREEVLAFYAETPSKRALKSQALLPQSPRKTRTIPPPPQTKAVSAKKKGRPRGRGTLFRKTDANSTLTQSNFLTSRLTRQPSHDAISATDTDEPDPEIDEDFLAALPEDIRKEVLEEQRRTRLAKKSALNLNPSSRKKSVTAAQQTGDQAAAGQIGVGRYILTLPPRPSRPTFTAQKLSSLPELREAINAWVAEFADDGPYDEDVGALIAYLARVICDEKDMAKAVGLTRWMDWVVDEKSTSEGNGDGFKDGTLAFSAKWVAAVTRVKEGVQEAVKARGLGIIEF